VKTGRVTMEKYNKILHFFEEYVATYSEYGQNAETISMMDKFYDPLLSFPEDMVTGREQWYKRCLNHPDVLDKLTIERCIIDDRKNEVSAILRTEAIDRGTGKVVMALRMSTLYKLRIDNKQDIRVTEVRIFLESNPEKVARLAELYRIGM